MRAATALSRRRPTSVLSTYRPSAFPCIDAWRAQPSGSCGGLTIRYLSVQSASASTQDHGEPGSTAVRGTEDMLTEKAVGDAGEQTAAITPCHKTRVRHFGALLFQFAWDFALR